MEDIFEHEVATTIKAFPIIRKGNPINRALFIKQENSNEVLKPESEVECAD